MVDLSVCCTVLYLDTPLVRLEGLADGDNVGVGVVDTLDNRRVLQTLVIPVLTTCLKPNRVYNININFKRQITNVVPDSYCASSQSWIRIQEGKIEK